MPTTWPRSTPTKHHNRFAGCSATAKPCISPLAMSIRAAPRRAPVETRDKKPATTPSATSAATAGGAGTSPNDEEGERRKPSAKPTHFSAATATASAAHVAKAARRRASQMGVRAENDQIGRAREDRDAIQSGRSPARARPPSGNPSRAPVRRCIRRARRARARTRSPGNGGAIYFSFFFAAFFAARFFGAASLSASCSGLRHELAHGAARRAELHRTTPGSLMISQPYDCTGGRRLDAVDLDREVVDARPLARRSRLRRLGAASYLISATSSTPSLRCREVWSRTFSVFISRSRRPSDRTR